MKEKRLENVIQNEVISDIDPLNSDQGVTVDQKLTVLIPYARSEAKGNELMYTILSLRKNLREDFAIVVIGDAEPFFEDLKITHIAHNNLSDSNANLAEVIKSAIVSDKISDEFILSYQNLYYVSPVTLADIAVIKKASSGYMTNTPIYLKKALLVDLSEKLNGFNQVSIIDSYYSTFYSDRVPIQLDWQSDNWTFSVITANPDKDTLVKYIARKKWMSSFGNGYSSNLISILSDMFENEGEGD